MRQPKLTLLTDKVFLFGLLCLLTNDLILKYQIGGFITGKLSDISGLFIFPFFWSILFERHHLRIYLFTALIFVIWKTPLSTDLLSWTNNNLGTGFARVVDYTDLAALSVLPISYHYSRKRIQVRTGNACPNRMFALLITGVSLFAFVATSLPRKRLNTDLYIGESYIIELNKEEIFRNRIEPARSLNDSLKSNLADSLFFLGFGGGGHDFIAEVKIYQIDERKTSIEFVSLKSYTIMGGLFGLSKKKIKKMEQFMKDDYKSLFESGVIETIKTKDRFESDIFYWNPKLDPIILEGK